LVGERELGLYAAVLPISQVWQALPMAAYISLVPVLTRQRSADADAYQRSIIWTFRVFFLAGVASAILTCSFAGILVRLLFGTAYTAAVPVLAIHSVSNVFCFLGIAHSLWLTNEGMFSVRLYGTLLASCANVSLNFILLPSIGLIGAAWAAVVSQAIASFLANALFDKPGFRLQCAAIGLRKSAA
jgi:PST family polysaccharide transporter